MTLEERIQAGLDGKFKGLANGFDRLNNYIYGVQRGVYTLLGGMSGTFKTTLLDYILLNALEEAERLNISINVFYYSFEISALQKQANWLSVRIKQKHGVTIAPEVIKGYGENRLNEEELRLVKLEIPYIDKLFKKINFTFTSINPTGIYKELWEFMSKRGTLIKEPYTDYENKEKEKIVKFIPNNPEEYNLVFIDHYALLKKERGFSTKEVIDKMSEFFVELRNLFGISIFAVQQFNQTLNTVDRQKFKGVDLSPQQNDFRDSTNPYQDAEIVCGTLNAKKMDMESSLGYNINLLGKNYIMFKIIKNRLSEDSIAIGLLANPKAGEFIELPKPGSQELERIYEKLK